MKFNQKLIKEWLEIVALIVAGIWVVSIFFWKEWFMPEFIQLPTLLVEANVTKTGNKHGTLVPLQINQKIVNTSRTDAGIFAAWYHIYGVEVQVRETSPDTGHCQLVIDQKMTKYNRLITCSPIFEKLPLITTTVCDKPIKRLGIVVDSGKTIDENQGITLRPGEEIERDFTTHIPSTFHVARIEIEVRFSRPNEKIMVKWNRLSDGSMWDLVYTEAAKYDACDDKENYERFLEEHKLKKVHAIKEVLLQ